MTNIQALQVPVLTLTLAGDADGVRSVTGYWSPLPVERLLTGREAASVDVVLNTMLALCRHAQCAASAHALAAAQATNPLIVVNDEAVELEAARETLRRWLIDFPSVFGGVWDNRVVAQWTRLDTRERMADFCTMQVFGTSARAWLALPEAGLAQWAANTATLPARWLHDLLEHAMRPVSLSPARVLQHVRENAGAWLAGQPQTWPAHADLWNEPTHAPDLASALLLARLRRLARFCANPAHEANGANGMDRMDVVNTTAGSLRHDDIGIGWARCARGVLVHLARIENGKVAAYRIIAPTRWNFGPANLLQDALRDLPWSVAQPLARRLALLLDPCAPYRIEVHHA